MPRLWNIDIAPAVIDPYRPAIAPGDFHDFTDEQVEAGIGGLWSETDPYPQRAKKEKDRASKVKKTTDPDADAPEKE